MHTGFWWESYKSRDQKQDLDICGNNMKMDLRETVWGVWTGFIRFRTGPSVKNL
jgi:hypothetical protein